MRKYSAGINGYDGRFAVAFGSNGKDLVVGKCSSSSVSIETKSNWLPVLEKATGG